MIENMIIDALVERAIQYKDIEMFVEEVHKTVKLPGFDEALFIRLYREATPDAQRKADQLLRRQEQPDASPAMLCETA